MDTTDVEIEKTIDAPSTAETPKDDVAPAAGDAPPTQDVDDEDADDGGRRRKSGWARQREELRQNREEIRELRNMLMQTLQGNTQKHAQQNAPAEPDPKQYETVGEYARALTEWMVGQKVPNAVAEVRSAIENQVEAREAQKRFVNSLDNWKDRPKDFHEVLDAAGEVPSDVARALMEMDEGPKVAYAIASDPGQIEKLRKMPQARRLVELGKIAAKVSAAAVLPKVTVTSKPITPAGGGGTASRASRLASAQTIAEIRAALK